MFSLLSEKTSNLIKIFGFCLILLVVYILVYLFNLQDCIQFSLFLFIVLSALTVGCSLHRQYDSEKLVAYILFIGFVVRIGYMLYTPCTTMGHDFEGHAAYIQNMLDGHLPESNEDQFYHPPLFYFLSAVVIFILKPILGLTNEIDIINCARLVSCFFSCMTLYCVKSLCTELKIKKPIPLALTAFLPNFFFMGARVNNDAIVVFFMTMILLYSIRWYKEQNRKNTVILALSFGLGMMSKMSVAVLAIPTGLLMLYVLAESIKTRTSSKTIKSLFLFGFICIPLGLAYPIRNLILFDQPFTYVLDVGSGIFASENYSFIQRFLTFPITRMFNPVYNDVFNDYNIWMYLLKGGLFGEFSFDIPRAIPVSLLILYSIISLFMVISVIWSLRTDNISINYLELSGIELMFAYIAFNIRYPYGCTMDFRYIAPVFIINSLLLGRFFDLNKDKKYGKPLYHVTSAVISIFSLLSLLLLCII